MSFNMVRCTDDDLLGREAEASVRRALSSFGRATIFVPSYQAQLDVSRELADRGGLALGVGVTTPEAWAAERWGVWGDGTRVVGSLVRVAAMQRALLEESRRGRTTVAYNVGTVNLLARLAREALPWLPLVSGDVDRKRASECGLTAAEADAVGIVGAYGRDIARAGYVEESSIMASVVDRLRSVGAATSISPVVVLGFSSVSRSQRELMASLAACTEVTFCRPALNAEAMSELDLALDCIRASCAAAGIEACEAGAAASPVAPAAPRGRDLELSALLERIFLGSEKMVGGGAVSLVLPAGPLAEAEAVAQEAVRLVRLGDEEIVVSATDVDRAWRELSPKLFARGIGAVASISIDASRIEAGRAFVEFAETVARLSELNESWPEPEACEEGTRVNLGDMSWWPPRSLSDFLLNDISHVPTSRAMRLDAAWRSDRLLTPADVLGILQNERMTSREVAAATRELIKGRVGSAAAKLLQPYVSDDASGSEVEDLIFSEVDGEVSVEVCRPVDRLSDARAIGALGAVLSVAGTLRELGVTSDANADDRVPLVDLVDYARRVLGQVKVVVRPTLRPDGARAVVRIMSPGQAAALAPCSVDALVVCGQTSSESPVEGGDDVGACILEGLGVEPAADPLARSRSAFYRQLAAARNHISLERTLFDSDSKECYPSVMLTELLSCYGAEEAAGRAAAGLEALFLGEDEATRNLSACGVAPTPSRAETPGAAGVVSGAARALINVPREGRAELLDGKPMLSASQIESYLECPYKWFSLRRLRLQDSDAGFGAMEMGTFAHRVLEVTHGTLLAEALARMESSGAPVPDVEGDPSLRVPGSRVSPDDPELIAHAKEILSDELDLHLLHQFIREGKRSRYQAFVPHSLEERDLLRVLRRDLCGVVDYEADLFAGYEPRFFELDFGHGVDLAEYAGVWINGTVDRIDVDAHGNALVIDYKHKSSVGFMGEYGALRNDGADGELVLPRHVQSLIYGQVVRRSHPELKVKGALYLSTKGERHALSGAVDENQMDRVFGPYAPGAKSRALVSVSPGSSFGVDGESGMDALLDATERAISEKVSEMLDGRIGANPRDAGACSYCPVNNCEKRISK